MNQVLFWQILLQLALIALNAVFACAEIAVLSISDAKLEKLAEDGNKKASKLQRLKSNPARFLATIQVAITLSGFLGSAFAAENFSELIVDWVIKFIPISPATLEAISVVVITILLSFITLVFGELVPKRVAMRKAEKMALGFTGTIRFISVAFAPLVWLLTCSTNGILRLMGIDPNAEDSEVSEEEITLMADDAAEKGIIDEEENSIIQNVFEFNDLTVGEAMTHRTEMVILWKEETVEEWRASISASTHTFYPICDETVDHVIGILDARRFFRLDDQSIENVMKKAVDEPLFVSGFTKTDDLFRQMKSSKVHFAIVIDEFGGTDGIITIHDLIELLVGELEESPSDIIEMGDDTYKIACDTELTKVERELKFDLESDAATFSGWIVEQLGFVPPVGEEFTYEKIAVTVTAADEKLVQEAIIKIEQPEEE